MKAGHRRRHGQLSGRVDPVLAILIAALAASVAAFLAGWLPYPFGVLVFGFFIAARAMSLRRAKRSER